MPRSPLVPALRPQPNERRCGATREVHVVEVPRCCPVSGNPQPGSTLRIAYMPADSFLEVASLDRYIRSYVGGRESVRSMEGLVQQVAQDAADVLLVPVRVAARLLIEPGPQRMIVQCRAVPQ